MYDVFVSFCVVYIKLFVYFFFFFFLMIRRPPRSTPFPTRRSSDLADQLHRPGSSGHVADRHPCRERSEEHTSELQSRQYLVCRLLLEKKKKHKKVYIPNKEKKDKMQKNKNNKNK